MHVWLENSTWCNSATHTQTSYQEVSRSPLGSQATYTSTSTQIMAALALLQPCRAPRVLVTRSHGLYLNCAVRRDYSSPGRTGSTSTTSCAADTRLPVTRALPQPCHAPSCRSTSRRLVALALTMRLVTASRDATTRRPECTGSTAPMSCIRTRNLDARLLVGRSHWLSSRVRSLRLTA
jgi:hypothetical protein